MSKESGMDELPSQPSLPWRIGSSLTTGIVGLLCRTFLIGFNRLEINGLDSFLELLDERKDVDGRTKGLITVSNHLCVMDDPIIWGSLPYAYHFNADNLRWSLASHDIVFKNRSAATFFSLGNTLPTHRLAYSQHGGLFQPTITQAIRLLSRGPFTNPLTTPPPSQLTTPSQEPNISDPFSSSHLTYSTDGSDLIPAPSAYATRRHAWIHVFPEGKIHQHPLKAMRYFKWGVARLILEAEPMAPDLVPIWVEGMENVMTEDRGWPRGIPRAGKDVTITFGERVDGERVFGDLRERWRGLVEEARKRNGDGVVDRGVGRAEVEVGVLRDEELRTGPEAVALREECTLRVRREVLKVRTQRGLPDEDPKWSLVETWKAEGGQGKREGRMEDGSLVRDT